MSVLMARLGLAWREKRPLRLQRGIFCMEFGLKDQRWTRMADTINDCVDGDIRLIFLSGASQGMLYLRSYLEAC